MINVLDSAHSTRDAATVSKHSYANNFDRNHNRRDRQHHRLRQILLSCSSNVMLRIPQHTVIGFS